MGRELAQLTKTDVKKLILGLLAHDTGRDYSELVRQVDSDLDFDAQVDSLSMANIVANLEHELGVTIENDEFTPERLRSLDGFSEFLVDKVSATEANRAAS